MRDQVMAKAPQATSAEFEANRQRRSFDASLYNTCSTSLVADEKYYNGPRGGSSVPTCTAAMIYTTIQASHIYETSDFPSGIGYGQQFSIEAITIFTSATEANNPYPAVTCMPVACTSIKFSHVNV